MALSRQPGSDQQISAAVNDFIIAGLSANAVWRLSLQG
jgi:hypothetical protein